MKGAGSFECVLSFEAGFCFCLDDVAVTPTHRVVSYLWNSVHLVDDIESAGNLLF